MRIDESIQADLILRDAVVIELKVQNNLPYIKPFADDSFIFDVDYSEVSVDEENEDIYLGQLCLTTKVKHNCSDRSTKLLLEMKQIGIFAALKRQFPSKDEFVDAIKYNGVASLISMSRSTIAAISSNIFIAGTIKLPLINVYELNEKKAQQELKPPKERKQRSSASSSSD